MDIDKNLMRGLKLADFAIMLACFALSAISSFIMSGNDVIAASDFLAVRISVANIIVFSAFAILWHVLFSAFGLYQDLLHSSVFKKAKDVL